MTRICPLAMYLAILVATCMLVGGTALAIEPAEISAVWLLNGDVDDSEGAGVNGTLKGGEFVTGLRGQALKLNGKSDGVKLPDSNRINTGGPFPKRTIMALFNCDDVSIDGQKQTVFEEGGRTRGAVIYVFEGAVWAGAWNRAEYNWNGAWLSAPIQSGRWYYAALVLRDTQGKVEDDKFEMWLDGHLIGKEAGGQLHAHGDDNSIGHVNQNTVFHDDDGSGSDIHYFGGLIDEVRVYNASLTEKEMGTFWNDFLAVEPAGKLTTLWGRIKK